MTPKEKAFELFEKFYQIGKNHDFNFAKECALIAVDEIINILDYPSTQCSFYLAVNIELEKL